MLLFSTEVQKGRSLIPLFKRTRPVCRFYNVNKTKQPESDLNNIFYRTHTDCRPTFSHIFGQIQNEQFCLSAYFMTGNFYCPFYYKNRALHHCDSNISDQRRKKTITLSRLIPCIWPLTIKILTVMAYVFGIF